MTITELLKAIEAEGADKSALITAYTDDQVEGLKNKNTELILKLKDSKSASDAKQVEFDDALKESQKDMAPLELQLSRIATDMEAMKKERDDANAKSEKSDASVRTAKISGELQTAFTASKIIPDMVAPLISQNMGGFNIDDAGFVVTTDGKGLSPEKFVADLKIASPGLWPASQGAGATGGNGGMAPKDNPFKTRDYDAQTKLAKENPELATRLHAEAAA